MSANSVPPGRSMATASPEYPHRTVPYGEDNHASRKRASHTDDPDTSPCGVSMYNVIR